MLIEKDSNIIQEGKFMKEERGVIEEREVIAQIIKEVTDDITTTQVTLKLRLAILMRLCEVTVAIGGRTGELGDLKESEELYLCLMALIVSII